MKNSRIFKKIWQGGKGGYFLQEEKNLIYYIIISNKCNRLVSVVCVCGGRSCVIVLGVQDGVHDFCPNVLALVVQAGVRGGVRGGGVLREEWASGRGGEGGH
jgi:hypothetical protein